MNYYNDFEPYACEWIENLATAGHIPQGKVDCRSIKEVQADELRNYKQCHFFAGLGGWSHALRLAGWPDDLPIWTGSAPCQPFSAAGKRKGTDDERHLWPVFFDLIRACRPQVIMGEQVSSKDGLAWFDGVQADFKAEGYTCWGADICAAGVGAPHIRQRLWWVAYSDIPVFQRISPAGQQPLHEQGGGVVRMADTHEFGRNQGRAESERGIAATRCESGGTGLSAGIGDRAAQERGSLGQGEREGRERELGGSGASGGLGDAADERHERGGSARERRDGLANNGVGSDWLGDTSSARLEGRQGKPGDDGSQLPTAERAGGDAGWSSYRIVHCTDGKARRVSAESGDEPLAYGLPRNVVPLLSRMEGLGIDAKAGRGIIKSARRNRNGRLKGMGNAIVSPLAAEFVRAFMDFCDTVAQT